MDVKKAREELAIIASRLYDAGNVFEANKICTVIADHLHQRKRIRNTAQRSRPCTKALAKEIRAYAAANPGDSSQKIADIFNVNPGRVSEALNGRR